MLFPSWLLPTPSSLATDWCRFFASNFIKIFRVFNQIKVTNICNQPRCMNSLKHKIVCNVNLFATLLTPPRTFHSYLARLYVPHWGDKTKTSFDAPKICCTRFTGPSDIKLFALHSILCMQASPLLCSSLWWRVVSLQENFQSFLRTRLCAVLPTSLPFTLTKGIHPMVLSASFDTQYMAKHFLIVDQPGCLCPFGVLLTSLLLCNLFDASQIVLTNVFCAIAQCDADSHLFLVLLKGDPLGTSQTPWNHKKGLVR